MRTDTTGERAITIRPAADADRERLAAVFRQAWGATTVVAHGVRYELTSLPTLVAERDAELVGVLTYQVSSGELEIVSIDAFPRGTGVGTALLQAAVAEARRRNVSRLWLITTNDNVDAVRFYQRRGLRLCRVRPGAVDLARQHKPSIPLVGGYGIEIHDEWEFELRLETLDLVAAGRAAALAHLRWHHGHADTWPLYRDPTAVTDVVRALAHPFLGEVDVVLGPEARGLPLGALVAAELAVPFAPVRKKGGALPGPRWSTDTAPDYLGRRHTIGIQQAAVQPGQRVLVVDDWAESGALLAGVAALVRSTDATMAGVALVVDEMPDDVRAGLVDAAVRVHALIHRDDLPPL